MKITKLTGTIALSALLLNQLNQRFGLKEAWQPTHVHEPRIYLWEKGKIVYQVYGSGKPLLLVHGFGTGASSYEWHKNIDDLARHFKVYTLDLLGFGLSDKPRVNYLPKMFIQLLHDFVYQVIGEPVQCIAQTHTCSYIIQLMHDKPDMFGKTIFINPYGFEHHFNQSQIAPIVNSISYIPILNRTFYQLMTSPWNIKSFLQGEYFDTEMITEEAVSQYHHAALEAYPQAHLAPLAFLRGELNHTIEQLWLDINQRTTIFAGKSSRVYPFEFAEDFFRMNKQTELHTFERAGLFLQSEDAYTFNQAAIAFLDS